MPPIYRRQGQFCWLGLPFMGWLAVWRISPSCQQQIDLSLKAPHLSCVKGSGVSLGPNCRGPDYSRAVTVAGALVNLLRDRTAVSLCMFLNGSSLYQHSSNDQHPSWNGERRTFITLFQLTEGGGSQGVRISCHSFCIMVGVSTVDVCQS